jgi:hypothetical protein
MLKLKPAGQFLDAAKFGTQKHLKILEKKFKLWDFSD